MTRGSTFHPIVPWVLAPLVGLFALGFLAEHGPDLALVNESPSLPRGVYFRAADQTPARGDIVAIDQPDAARAYLAALGMPTEVRLLKRVVAAGGDRVCRRREVVWTPRRRATAKARDRRGVPLPTWEGCRTLAPDELFLLGDTPGSFDSRYFGPVRRPAVGGVYRETLTW